MRRWFLSYTSLDFALMQALKSALQQRDASAHIFFAPEAMRAGGFWQQQLADEIARSNAFVLLVGETGVGPWQVMEYYEALDRRAKEPNYPLILVLCGKRAAAPGLPFARQLHWVVTDDPASEATVGRLIDAASGSVTRPGELWRHTRPYRGLEAMTEANSDFFFGRGRETVEVINALASERGKLVLLLGNSGVGKSSLAQAGVLASLLRQQWPDQAKDTGPWPMAFDHSRHWCFLALRPGTDPVKALVDVLLERWQFKAGAERIKEQKEMVGLLNDGSATLSDLLDQTEKRYQELGQSSPPAFLLYIDQGEELYVRAEKEQRHRFSKVVASGLGSGRDDDHLGATESRASSRCVSCRRGIVRLAPPSDQTTYFVERARGMTWRAMCGGGCRIAISRITMARPPMAQPGQPVIVRAVWSAAVRGSTVHGTFAPPSATGSPLSTGSTSWVSGSLGRS
jgi:TIR domain